MPANGGLSVGGVAIAGGLAAGGLAAVLVSLLACWAAQLLVSHRSSGALWRPAAFIALQERPG
jgi:hypothetical protein